MPRTAILAAPCGAIRQIQRAEAALPKSMTRRKFPSATAIAMRSTPITWRVSSNADALCGMSPDGICRRSSSTRTTPVHRQFHPELKSRPFELTCCSPPSSRRRWCRPVGVSPERLQPIEYDLLRYCGRANVIRIHGHVAINDLRARGRKYIRARAGSDRWMRRCTRAAR